MSLAAPDTKDHRKALRAFKGAWRQAVVDYADHRINSEHCLQAVLYSELRGALPRRFKIFSEATIVLPKRPGEKRKKKVVIDLLVCADAAIVAAIELKFLPRAAPERQAVRKDLLRLSRLTELASAKGGVDIEMPRFNSGGGEPFKLSIDPGHNAIFGVFCKGSPGRFQADQFWGKHSPEGGAWEKELLMPAGIGVAVAATAEGGTAIDSYFGALLP